MTERCDDVIESGYDMFGSTHPDVGEVGHPSWCDEWECRALSGGAGKHASERGLVPGEMNYATAVYVEQSTDDGPQGPVQVVIGVMRAGLEGTIQRWPLAAARAVHAALGDVLDRLGPEGSA